MRLFLNVISRRLSVAAAASLAGSDYTNNHKLPAEWLCQYAGDEGVAKVVCHLRRRAIRSGSSRWHTERSGCSVVALSQSSARLEGPACGLSINQASLVF